MRFAICTIEGSTLAWWRRLKDEGHDVLVYHYPDKNGPGAHRNVGVGLVPIASSREAWVRWGAADNDTVWFFDCTGAGDFAESLRASGKMVVGGGKLPDRLETDREFGEKMAEKCGVLMPPSKTFTTITAAIEFLKSNPQQQYGDGGWAWKSSTYLEASATFVGKTSTDVIEYLEYARSRFRDNVTCVLQEKIDGVALSTAQWFNGRAWVGPVEATLEKKKFMNGEKGPATGCSLNTIWFYNDKNPKVCQALNWDAIGAMLREKNAPPGLYDINAIVNRRGAWFLEWTPRLGIDSELTSQRAIANLGEFLHALAVGGAVDDMFATHTAYHAVRLSVPPYPNEAKGVEKLKSAGGVMVNGADGLWKRHFVGVGLAKGEHGLEVADPYGFVGVVVSEDVSLRDGYEAIYNYIDKKLRCPTSIPVPTHTRL